ncbi:MAG TPA: hypothetical protein VGO93_01395, partial [Candidatus Xenobia bacterium]
MRSAVIILLLLLLVGCDRLPSVRAVNRQAWHCRPPMPTMPWDYVPPAPGPTDLIGLPASVGQVQPEAPRFEAVVRYDNPVWPPHFVLRINGVEAPLSARADVTRYFRPGPNTVEVLWTEPAVSSWQRAASGGRLELVEATSQGRRTLLDRYVHPVPGRDVQVVGRFVE